MRYAFPFCLALFWPHPLPAQHPSCALNRDSAISAQATWGDLLSRYSCQWASSERFHTQVLHLLLSDWPRLSPLDSAIAQDSGNLDIVLRELDAHTGLDTVTAVGRLAAGHCPAALLPLCAALRATTDSAELSYEREGTSIPAPPWQRYAVTDTAGAMRHQVDLRSSPHARAYRTRLREAAKGPPSFAGHYAFAEWGCGSSCQEGAIVDLRSGAVHWLPTWAVAGWTYRRDSRLVVRNGGVDTCFLAYENPSTTPAYAVYYRWTGRRFAVIDSVSLMCFDQRSN